MIIDRLTTLIKRRRVASKLKVDFKRSASFRLPKIIIINDGLCALNLPDENGVKVAFVDLLLDDCYGCRNLRRSRVNVNTILDIGANVGLFGLAARNVFPNAIIHSYEPNHQLEQYLSVQAQSAGFDYYMEAVGLEDGMISLELNEDSVQTRSKQDVSGSVTQLAFRKAIERLGGKVDLLKMDCEGAEWEIFKDKESWKKISNLSMEYHLFGSGQTEQRVRAIIEDLGFTITSFVPIEGYGLLTANR